MKKLKYDFLNENEYDQIYPYEEYDIFESNSEYTELNIRLSNYPLKEYPVLILNRNKKMILEISTYTDEVTILCNKDTKLLSIVAKLNYFLSEFEKTEKRWYEDFK